MIIVSELEELVATYKEAYACSMEEPMQDLIRDLEKLIEADHKWTRIMRDDG